MMHAPALTLTDLAEAIRAARAAAAAAFESGFDRVREIGDRLKIAKQMAGHGHWGEFLKICELNDRTARQYIQFAELAAKAVPGTDLSGLSIKAAIKLLSPPKPPETHQEAEAPEAPASEASPEVPAPAPEDDPSDSPEGADDKFDPTPPVEESPAPPVKDTALREFDDYICRLLQMTGKAKPERLTKTGVHADELARLGDFLVKVALAMRVAAKRTPPAPKHSPAKSRDPLKVNWRHLNANDLEDAIRDAQQYGVDHHGKETHQHKERRLNQLDRMKKHSAELRAAERAVEAATRH